MNISISCVVPFENGYTENPQEWKHKLKTTKIKVTSTQCLMVGAYCGITTSPQDQKC
jgi:hypothetical protein